METAHTTTPTTTTTSNTKRISIFLLVIVVGLLLFVLPNVFFHVFKVNEGFQGVNLLITAAFQFTTVTGLVYWALKQLRMDGSDIGLTAKHWQKDTLLGSGIGLSWAVVQFAFLIPATGGAGRADIQQILQMMDGSVAGLIYLVALGVIGGGITEEIFNRAFFITVLGDSFRNKKRGMHVAAVLSILFFAVGHLPGNWVEWIDILLPTFAYTLLFLYTKRLTASIVAHGLYNLLAILLTYFLYYR